MDLITLIPLITAALGFLGALSPVRAWLVRLWKKTLGRRGEQLNRIEQELKPNGNTSMRDAIDRIEDRQYDFEAFMNATLNTEKDAIFRTDVEGKLFAINRAHQRLLGYSIGEMEGEGWKNAVHLDDRAKIVKQWEETVAAGTELNEDIKFLHADGSSMVLHANVYREIDGQGIIRGYLGVISNKNELPVCPHSGACTIDEKSAG